MSYESCKPPFSTPNLTETGPNFFFGVKNRFFFRRKRNGFCPRRDSAAARLERAQQEAEEQFLQAGEGPRD